VIESQKERAPDVGVITNALSRVFSMSTLLWSGCVITDVHDLGLSSSPVSWSVHAGHSSGCRSGRAALLAPLVLAPLAWTRPLSPSSAVEGTDPWPPMPGGLRASSLGLAMGLAKAFRGISLSSWPCSSCMRLWPEEAKEWTDPLLNPS